MASTYAFLVNVHDDYFHHLTHLSDSAFDTLATVTRAGTPARAAARPPAQSAAAVKFFVSSFRVARQASDNDRRFLPKGSTRLMPFAYPYAKVTRRDVMLWADERDYTGEDY